MFAQAALVKKSHKALLEQVFDLCKAIVDKISKDDPSKAEFVQAYQAVSTRILELETES